ncbi:hypothetical protein PMAYCL1PPCAC_08935, partial [Pristionchus mayeri]
SETTTTGPFCCNKCSKTFETSKSLKNHELIHSGFTCAECGARVKSEDRLDKHFSEQHPGKYVRVREGDGTLECDVCEMAFDYPSALAEHMRSHTGEKPFSCAKCSATFALSRSLLVHRRSVHGDNPFECQECGESFARKIELAQHKKSHRN